jgi:hypothetical protein
MKRREITSFRDGRNGMHVAWGGMAGIVGDGRKGWVGKVIFLSAFLCRYKSQSY